MSNDKLQLSDAENTNVSELILVYPRADLIK